MSFLGDWSAWIPLSQSQRNRFPWKQDHSFFSFTMKSTQLDRSVKITCVKSKQNIPGCLFYAFWHMSALHFENYLKISEHSGGFSTELKISPYLPPGCGSSLCISICLKCWNPHWFASSAYLSACFRLKTRVSWSLVGTDYFKGCW